MSIRFLLVTAFILALSASTAQAALTISSKQTKNVSCSGGVCTATSKHANLNADDLVALLGSSDVLVASGSKAKDIEVSVTGNLQWTSSHRLGLDSFHSLTFAKAVFYKGTGGGLDLKTNDGGTGGTLNFDDKGHIAFINANTATLTINGVNYVLIPSVHELSAAISTNPSGNFALYGPINAGVDGTYLTDPVTTIFQGHLEGLGNTIQHLRINVKAEGASVGLFYGIDGGTVTHFNLAGVKVSAGKSADVGALAGSCKGPISDVNISSAQVQGDLDSLVGGVCGVLDATLNNVHASGTATGDSDRMPNQGSVGGLVGYELGGTIINSSAAVHVAAGIGWTGGGLVGQNQNSIQQSFATGAVVVGDSGVSGGLVGNNTGVLTNSYATGTTQGGVNSTVGGFIGLNNGPVSDSYSSGAVESGSGNAVGGFIGNDLGAADLTDTYFDTTTSGQSHGVGNNTGYPGVTGLTTEEFQAGLPTGFDPAVWVENPGINDGLPYLLANPPG